MTKQELIDAVVAKADAQGIKITKKDAGAVIDDLFGVVSKAVLEEDKFSFPGFGTLKKTYRKAREGRNPQNGNPITIPASYSVSFQPAPALKERLNG